MVANLTLNMTNASAVLTSDMSTAIKEIKPLTILIIAIFIYSLFIFKFYRFLADKNIIKQRWHKKYEWEETIGKKIMKTILFTVEYLIMTPIAVFFWFFVLAGLLLLLSNNPANQILLISMAIIGSIRIAAHYNNDLSKDLAKMIPFTFLGVYIIEMKTISLSQIATRGIELLSQIDIMFFFFLFIVALELIMRLLQFIIDAIVIKKEN